MNTCYLPPQGRRRIHGRGWRWPLRSLAIGHCLERARGQCLIQKTIEVILILGVELLRDSLHDSCPGIHLHSVAKHFGVVRCHIHHNPYFRNIRALFLFAPLCYDLSLSCSTILQCNHCRCFSLGSKIIFVDLDGTLCRDFYLPAQFSKWYSMDVISVDDEADRFSSVTHRIEGGSVMKYPAVDSSRP